MLGTVGKTVIGLGAGAIGVLAIARVRDDRYVDGIWRTLEQYRGTGEPFAEEMVSGLPSVARRYFLHAIQPGAPLASRVRFSYSGSIKPGKQMPWMSLSVNQILAKERGFVWKARAWNGPLFLTGADHYLDGTGRMRISLFGIVPVVNATGADLSRSAMARLLMESALLPSALLPAPNIRIEGIDDSRFRSTVELHGESTAITLTTDQDGRLRALELPRWGNLTADGSFRYIPYGIIAEEERSFGGYTVPSRLRGGWWYGTDQYQEVIRLEISRAEFA